jgi:hypothetical protein
MITISLMRKNYKHLAECLVPMGAQMNLSMDERAKMLKARTRPFSEAEITEKFRKKGTTAEEVGLTKKNG